MNYKAKQRLLHGKLGPLAFQLRRTMPRRQSRLLPDDEKIVKALQQEGVYQTSLDSLNLSSTNQFLSDVEAILPMLPSKVTEIGDSNSNASKNTQLHCTSIDPPKLAEQYPSILLWGLEERLLRIVENYIGTPIAFTTVHVRKDIGSKQQVGTRIWHLDNEDHRIIRLIVYLSDVTSDDGPFEYIPKPLTVHCKIPKSRKLSYGGLPILDDEMSEHIPTRHWKQCTGDFGTVILVDTAKVLHHGKIHESERNIAIYTYTTRQPRYPKISRNHEFTKHLSKYQQNSFFVKTNQ